MSKLRGICVGAGYFSRFHLDAWNRIPEVEIVAICDHDHGKARQEAAEFNVPRAVSTLEEADGLAIDFVDIITPPSTHYELVRKALDRGLAIICQKPLAPEFKTCVELTQLVLDAGTPFMVHENFRFQPWHREIKRLLDQGSVGRRLHSLYFRSRPGDGWGPDAYLDRQPYFREMSKLLVHETGVHFIDIFRYLAGEIREVSAVLRRLNPVIAGEDTGLLTFHFANGAVGVWDANRFNECTAPDPRYTFGDFLVEGDGGSVRLDNEGQITLKPLGQPERRHEYEHSRLGFAGDCVYFTQRHFVEKLQSGKPFETNAPDYLQTLRVQEAVYRSAEENRPVGIKEIDDALPLPPTAPMNEDPDAAPVPTAAAPIASGRRVVDLSVSISNALRGASVESFKTLADDGWNATTLTLYSHCGTHMDSPRHFLDGGPTIDQVPLEACVGSAKVLDLTPVQPRELISVERLAAWADSIGPGDRLLFRTDWHLRLGTDEYRNALPRISVELARWLVERNVALVGVEPPSVADVNDMEELTEVHQTLLRGNVVIVEGLAHLDKLAQPVVEFIALPLHVDGGDATPVRAVAIENAD